MTKHQPLSHNDTNMKRYFLILAACWSLLMMLAMAYHMKHSKDDFLEMALIRAKVAFDKDFVYRKWAASKGGVYGRVDDDTPPNPYLHVPERDIKTPSGQKLTLINPAYMTRQVQEMEHQRKGVLGHLTSLNPIRPQNAPDAWEKKGLLSFEQGTTEVSSLGFIDGQPYMRFMKPFFVSKGCLKCHEQQGYKIGDIRGGISISVPMAESNSIERSRLTGDFFIYFCFWFLGLAGLAFGSNRLHKQLEMRKKTEGELGNFKMTLDKIHDCVFMFAPDSLQFFYVNHGAIDQLGYSEEELLQMTPVDIKPDYTEQSFRELLQPLLDRQEASLFFETMHWHKNGYAIPVEILMQHIVPEGEKGRFVAIIRDISGRKKDEQEKDKMQSRLLQSQKLESVGQLAAGIAHEINTPTQYVGTNIDFLDEAFQDIDRLMNKYQGVVAAVKNKTITGEMIKDVEEAVDEVDWDYLAAEIPTAISQSREGIKRVTKIVRAMKEFSHPGSNEKGPADLNKIIKNTATVASNEWKYAADMKMDLSPDLPEVSCLTDEMGQVFLNIIVNAAHAISEKIGANPETGKGLISISSRLDGEWVEVRIKDNGCGMPDIVQERIFDPFFTTKEVGKGTGQGLTIANDVVVDKHNGTITIESEMGAGTTFIIRLPV